jgi:hypothetical protein
MNSIARTTTRATLWSAVGVALTAATAFAQDAPASPTAQVPVREVTPVISRSAQPLTSANMVRPLSDGSVLVNDT